MQFHVDPARLGARFAAPGVFEVKAPAGWEPLPDSLLRAAMARFAADSHAADAPGLRAVYRQADGAALAISQFPAQLATAARSAMAESVTSALRARYPGARVEPSRFHYQGLEIAQVMLQDSTRVVFKLLVDRPGAPLYQLDYVVPLPVYRREVESLESSIGSLRTQS